MRFSLALPLSRPRTRLTDSRLHSPALPSAPQATQGPALPSSSSTLPSASLPPPLPLPLPLPTPSPHRPLARTPSLTARLTLYPRLLHSFTTHLSAVKRNEAWYKGKWSTFAEANSRALKEVGENQPPPPMMMMGKDGEEEEEEWPASLEGVAPEEVGKVYESLEGREKECGRRHAEWQAWKSAACARADEVKRRATSGEAEVRLVLREGGEGEGEGTPRVLVRKRRRVEGTGGGGGGVMTPTSSVGGKPTTPAAVAVSLGQRAAVPSSSVPPPAPILAAPPRSSTPLPAAPPHPSSTTAVPIDPHQTPLAALAQTPRKNKRRSDILHLSASGRPPPSTVRKAVPVPVLFREALEAARREEVGEGQGGKEEKVEQEPEKEDEGAGVQQPESSWEPEPDTQEEEEEEGEGAGVGVMEPDDEEEEEGGSRTLVPPSSSLVSAAADHSVAPSPAPKKLNATTTSAPGKASRPLSLLLPLSPSARHTNRAPDPHPRAPDTQALIEMAERSPSPALSVSPAPRRAVKQKQKQQEQGMSMPPSAQPRLVRERKSSPRRGARVKAEPESSSPGLRSGLGKMRGRSDQENEEEEEDVKPDMSSLSVGKSRKRRRASSASSEEEEEDEQEPAPLRALDDPNFSDLDQDPFGNPLDPGGHHWMRRMHAKRKREVELLRAEKERKA